LMKEKADILFTSLSLPVEHEALKMDMFSPQYWVAQGTHFYIGTSPWGVGEVRCLLSGSYCIGALKYESVPGATLQKKVTNLLTDTGMTNFCLQCCDATQGCANQTGNLVPLPIRQSQSGNFECKGWHHFECFVLLGLLA
jgi:hypothetical protein